MGDMRLVVVKWFDSFGVGQKWQSLDDIQDVAHICTSVGYLALDGDKVKVIVPHVSPENPAIGADWSGCGDMAIPSKAIISIEDLVVESGHGDPVEKEDSDGNV